MEYAPAIAAVSFVAFAVVSRRLGRSAVTGTMLFTALGLVLGPGVLDLLDFTGFLGEPELVAVLFTGTLVVVLFTDANAINSSNWRDDIIPARLLGIGLPLAIALGWLTAVVVLPSLEFWEAAVLATMLAPTDAALGKAVVSNERVPARIRQALNIESGLNDGIALPVFVVFLEAALIVEESKPVQDLVVELTRQVGVAVAVGVAVGWVGAKAMAWGRSSGQALGYWLQIGLVGLAVTAYALATPLGGSGFIAAWVAGFVFGKALVLPEDDSLSEFAESTGDLLTMASFLAFGVYLGPVLTSLTWQVVLYAVLSLVAVRTVAVALAVVGAGMLRPTVWYMGWFGPRGLATIILTIEIIDESGLRGGPTIADTALLTVGLSVLLHGATAWWGSNTYADYMDAHPGRAAMPEQRTPAVAVRVPIRARHQPETGRSDRR